MKTTACILMVLSGLAMAAEPIGQNDANTILDTAITTAGYTAGDSFTLTLDIADAVGGDNKFITLSGEYFIFNNNQNYYAFSKSTDGGNIEWATVTNVDSASNTVESGLDYGDGNKWFSYKGIENGAATKGTGSLDGGILTFEYDSDTKTTTITMKRTAGVVNVLNIVGYSLNAKEIDFANGSTYNSVSFSSKSIPEPTTATLSLLALAGLAARRRRK